MTYSNATVSAILTAKFASADHQEKGCVTILSRRLIVTALGGLAGAAMVGLLASNATILILGVLALGLGMALSILFYLLKPLPGELPDWSVTTLSASQPRRIAGTSAEVIQITGRLKQKDAGPVSKL